MYLWLNISTQNSELRTQTIVYSTLKLQMISKVYIILVNHKKHLGLGRHLLRQPKLSLAQMPPYFTVYLSLWFTRIYGLPESGLPESMVYLSLWFTRLRFT